jgi:preprotein translocase subunit SecY
VAAKEGLTGNQKLTNKILFTLAMLAIYRIGVQIPCPGLDGAAVQAFFDNQSGGLFGMFNTFSGGALERFSVLALGVMPYISASIIFQLLQSGVPYLEQLKKEGEQGRKKINQYTRYATVLLCIVQGYAMSNWLFKSAAPDGSPLVLAKTIGFIDFRILTVITLTAGTCFIMWLGEQITERGIGNGISLIIFAGIAAGMPGGAMSLWSQFKSGQLSVPMVLLLLGGMIFTLGFIIFMEVAQRRIPVQYSQKGAGKQSMQNQGSHLPLKINFANVIPPIFASSLLMFPATMSQFFEASWLKFLQDSFMPTGALYQIIFVALVVFFCFFYTEIVFNPEEVSDNLKKYGGFVPGVRAGRSTAEYIKRVLDRLTVVGAIYLSAVCVLPIILMQNLGLTFYFGGTSLLILVGVALDFLQQVQSHLLSSKYENMMKGARIKSRRVQY